MTKIRTPRGHDLIAWMIIGWTFAVTITRTIRLPNDYAQAYWLLDYRFGFIKRGLIGSLCGLLTDLSGIEMSPRLLVVLSALTFCGLFAALLVLIFRSRRQAPIRDDALIAGVVFASSPFVVMNAHLFGYLDALLYVLTIAAVALTLCDRPFLAALVSIAALLSHESYLLTGLPLVALASVATLRKQGTDARYRAHILALCMPVLAFVAIPLLQSLTTDGTALRQQLTDHLSSFGFLSGKLREVARGQTTPFLQLLRDQLPDFGKRLLRPYVLAAVGPPLLTLLIYIHASFRIRALSPFSILVLGIVCAPLAMHAAAWDTERISTYTIGGAFIASWILAETRQARKTHDLFLLCALLTLIVNAFGRMPLMDDEVDRFSNRTRLLMYLPAMALLLSIALRHLAPHYLTEFRDGWRSGGAGGGDGANDGDDA